MDRLQRDVDEWRRPSHSDLESSVNEQLVHLAAQMHEANLAAQEAAKVISEKHLEGGRIGVNANLETKCAKCGSLNKYCNHT